MPYVEILNDLTLIESKFYEKWRKQVNKGVVGWYIGKFKTYLLI
jgi:hypothetical protein